MNLTSVQQIINSIANNEKLAVLPLAVKLAKCIEEDPYDQTMGMISQVINKMADKKVNFIKRAQFKELYNRYYVNNTKFAEVFKDELNIQDKPIDQKQEQPTHDVDISGCGDPILTNVLSSIFDKEPIRTYSKDLGNKAIKLVSLALESWNLRPTNLIIADGNDKMLIVKADYETPKGLASFLVPVEIQKDKIIDSNVFVGNSGPNELNNLNIKSYIQNFAGNKLNVKASTLLQVVKETSTINPVKLAVAKLKINRATNSDFFQDQIVGQKISEASVKNVEVPKSEESFSFEKYFSTTKGITSYKFGEAVKIASDVISRTLKSFGYNSQIAVNNSNKDTIFYSVAINDKIGFVVPVKVSDGKVIMPKTILCNGRIRQFNKEAIEQLAIEETDYKVTAFVSPLFELSNSDIINNIRESLEQHDYVKAEEALNVLSQKDEVAYRMGFEVYKKGLMYNKAHSTCSFVIKNASSMHSICGHTGLPLHKVYQDKYGNCLPLYRRNIDESYENVLITTSKILG